MRHRPAPPCTSPFVAIDLRKGRTRIMMVAIDGHDNAEVKEVDFTFDVTPVYRFDGFFDPVSNPPTDNLVTAGRAIPVRFSLGGDRGTNVVVAGSPSSGSRSCSSFRFR